MSARSLALGFGLRGLKLMKILGISPAHDASVCLLDAGQIAFFSKEERCSREKRAKHFFASIEHLSRAINLADLDLIVIAAPTKDYGYIQFVRKYFHLRFGVDAQRVLDISESHHLQHAANAFYNSGFKEAAVVVVDRNGSLFTDINGIPLVREAESIFYARYPCEFAPTLRTFWRYNSSWCYHAEHLRQLLTTANPTCGEIRFQSRLGIVKVYEAATTLIGLSDWLGQLENGKTMGLSAYGRERTDIPTLFRQSCPIDEYFISADELSTAFLREVTGAPEQTQRVTRENFQEYADFARKVQDNTSDEVIALVRLALRQTGSGNVCLVGGYALNCVANQKLRSCLPPTIKLHVEALADDSGNSIGAAKLAHYYLTGDMTVRARRNSYFSGFHHDLSGLHGQSVTSRDVARLLMDKKVVALFQGRAEAGPRALGNRSILFDPRDPDGRELVNSVKKREWYRPFAATVLLEHAHEWFDLGNLAESPDMMYSLTVKRPELVPAVVHVDKTCRAQTLTRADNPMYYDLIRAFYKETGVPMVLNTSFNLAGEPLVDSPQDALSTMKRSALDYIYFPEVEKLISRQQVLAADWGVD
jgi:carbamoyltransferase